MAEELVGPAKVIGPFPPVTGSEDFACFPERKLGCFFRLGNGVGGTMLHNPKHDFNDEILIGGAEYWTRLVQRFLAEGVAPGATCAPG